MTTKRATMVAAAVLAVTAAACGSATTAAGGLEVDGAWARSSPMSAEAGAAYMQLSAGDEAVSIVAASVPSDVAGAVELHETVPVDETGSTDDGNTDDSDTDDSDTDGSGTGGEMAMTMRELAALDIPAGGSISLEPGGKHVMLLDLPDPLEVGEEFELTLDTATGEEIIVTVEVRQDAP